MFKRLVLHPKTVGRLYLGGPIQGNLLTYTNYIDCSNHSPKKWPQLSQLPYWISIENCCPIGHSEQHTIHANKVWTHRNFPYLWFDPKTSHQFSAKQSSFTKFWCQHLMFGQSFLQRYFTCCFLSSLPESALETFCQYNEDQYKCWLYVYKLECLSVFAKPASSCISLPSEAITKLFSIFNNCIFKPWLILHFTSESICLYSAFAIKRANSLCLFQNYCWHF